MFDLLGEKCLYIMTWGMHFYDEKSVCCSIDENQNSIADAPTELRRRTGQIVGRSSQSKNQLTNSFNCTPWKMDYSSLIIHNKFAIERKQIVTDRIYYLVSTAFPCRDAVLAINEVLSQT